MVSNFQKIHTLFNSGFKPAWTETEAVKIGDDVLDFALRACTRFNGENH